MLQSSRIICRLLLHLSLCHVFRITRVFVASLRTEMIFSQLWWVPWTLKIKEAMMWERESSDGVAPFGAWFCPLLRASFSAELVQCSGAAHVPNTNHCSHHTPETVSHILSVSFPPPQIEGAPKVALGLRDSVPFSRRLWAHEDSQILPKASSQF